ncbi:hypothetical protein SLS58_004597 [Diplodia intermedia]|uniref:Uncharacterized protein n=1 Tax=Diplodia intermedia TaxID=856260 RepID=A0ABR3TT84_9PEZI
MLDDFQRNVKILKGQAKGTKGDLLNVVALFDTGVRHENMIDLAIVKDGDFGDVCWYERTVRKPSIFHLILSRLRIIPRFQHQYCGINKSSLKVVGELHMRWQGVDKSCCKKKVFFAPKTYRSKFLVVKDLACDMVIGVQTMHTEGLLDQYACAGFRAVHPKPAENSHAAYQAQQRDKKLHTQERNKQVDNPPKTSKQPKHQPSKA